MGALPFLSSYILGASAWVGLHAASWGLILPIFLVFGVHPWIDLAMGRSNLGSTFRSTPRRVYQLVLFLYVPFQAVILWIGLNYLGSIGPSLFQKILFTFSLGLVQGGIGITAAHELIHRRSRFERALGLMLLSMVSFLHFRIEHVFGHHKWVGTPRDPASAFKGESLYRFWWRTVTQSWWSAFALNQNRMFGYIAVQGMIYGAIAARFGVEVTAYFALQSAVAILLLETINYIEHYGLRRRETANGLYEAVQRKHSWDSQFRMTNWFLFNLGRHADHHLKPLKTYDALDALDSVPQMPFGYSAMILLALVPPLWRRVMDPRVEAVLALKVLPWR